MLTAPRGEWVTNGGTLHDQRYSPLPLINRDDVKGLRALWRTATGSGTTPGHARQAQILAYEGVLGRNNMPTFRGIYDANQIRDVSEYIATVLPKGAAATVKP